MIGTAQERDFINGYVIVVDNRPVTDVPKEMRERGMLKDGVVESVVMPSNSFNEEFALAGLPVERDSGLFDKNRQLVKGALQAIAAWAFKRYGLERSNGCDLKSGMTGFMVEDLLRGTIHADTWTQTDFHPQAVAINRERHPGSNIKLGTWLRMQETLGFDGNISTATGLSALDKTQFLDEAIEGIRSALKPGGMLLHIQDLRPGPATGPREMAAMGFKPPHKVHLLPQPGPTSPILSYVLPNGEHASIGELFRRNLGRVLDANSGMEVLENRWVTARKEHPTGPGKIYHMNILLQTTGTVEEASAVVTVARRKS